MHDLTNLGQLAAQINAEHAAAEETLRAGLRRARKAGELLLQAKELVPHGGWLPWLKDNLTLSERTAQAYMRIAKHWPELEAKSATVADLSYRDGLKLLAHKEEEPDDPTLVASEAELGQGLARIREAALALREVRDRRLFRGTHPTFTDYCRERWDMEPEDVSELFEAMPAV